MINPLPEYADMTMPFDVACKAIELLDDGNLLENMMWLRDMYDCACEIDEEDDWLGAWEYEVTAYNTVYNKMKGLFV